MLEFNEPKIEDKIWADECLKHAKGYSSEYSFGGTFVWRTAYRTKIARYKNFYICRWGREPELQYSFPLGTGDFKDAVEQILIDAKENRVTPKIFGAIDYYKPMLDEFFPGKFTYEYIESASDYVYSVEKMATLSGKKLHGKRNHINNFIKENPNWSFEKIDSSNIDECISLHTSWINNKEEDVDYSFEFEAVLAALENYEKLNFVGGILRIDGKPIAYTMGEEINDELFVTHFEKAPAEIQGAYPLINREFTRNCLMSYKYVNREEDLGIEGLRKAKQSYYPEIMAVKGVAIYND